jgi:heme oxygenase (biliverdin-IX-beta and delta-forming)
MTSPPAVNMVAAHPSAANSPRHVMRRATQDIHERLHSHELFRDILAQTITREAYSSLLAKLYGFHHPVEMALIKHGRHAPGLCMEDRLRAHLVIADLNEVSPTAGRRLPLADPPSDLSVPGRLLGCLYVKEGATLGGRVLAAKLDHLFGSRIDGRRFFSGREADPALWRACCAVIDEIRDPSELDAMIAAAQETFETFERWMAQPVD